MLQPNSLIVLNNANNVALDYTHEEIQDWRYVSDIVVSSFLIKLSAWTINIPGIGWFVRQTLFDKVQEAYDVIVNYIDAHHKSLELLKDSVDYVDMVKIIEKEILVQIDHAELAIKIKIEDAFPDITQAVNHRNAEYFILKQQVNYVSTLNKNGQVEEKHA